MSLTSDFAPLAGVAALSALLVLTHRRLSARTSSRLLALSAGSFGVAVCASLWALTLGYLTHLAMAARLAPWCENLFGMHGRVPAVIGAPATMLSVLGAFRFTLLYLRRRRLPSLSAPDIAIVESEEYFAYSLPGRQAPTVISTALFDALDDAERHVVFAHEDAHRRYRHDRFLFVAGAADAAAPVLRPLTDRLRFSLERWADESAVRDLGGDRRLVARTIAKVSLLAQSDPPSMAMSFGSIGPAARAMAVLSIEPRHRVLAATAVAIALSASGLAVYQLHHLAPLLYALCN